MLRRIVAPTLWALRAYRGTALLISAVAATGLAALLPVASLVAPPGTAAATRLGLAAWRGADLGMPWSALASSPTATQRAALEILFRLLLGVATGVLAIAAVTIVSLSAARAAERSQEVKVRRAVGASRRAVLAAALVEAFAIAAVALAIGGILGALALRVVIAAWPGTIGPASPSANILTIVATLAGVVLGALAPLALRRRTSPFSGPTGRPLHLGVPAIQLGLGLTVLTAATLLDRAAGRLATTGATPSAVGEMFEITAMPSPPAKRAAQYAALLRRLTDRRSFDSVSLTSPGALVGSGIVDLVTTDCGDCQQGGISLPLQPVMATHYLVSPDTFRTLGLSVTAGRGITPADGWRGARVAVLSRSLAMHHFQNGKAVGRRILVGAERSDWYRVVGVVEDQRPAGFGAGLQPVDAVYLSVLQHPAPAVDLLVRPHRDPGTSDAVSHDVRCALGATGVDVVRLDARGFLARQAAPLGWFARALETEGWVILVLATVGTFVVMQLWVTSLLLELGVRRAVGARRTHILRFVLARAAGVALVGVAIGLWAGLVVWGTVASVAAGLPPWDPAAAVRFAPLLVGATLGGALLPAWRATHSTPTSLLASDATSSL
ncbi:MAG TPA: FtsX-like permease family protein [Gemmatimonadales bacterium]|jgi:putative ABC transport system permease protein